MRKQALIACFALLALPFGFAQGTQEKTEAPAQQGEWERIPSPPLPAFKPVEPIRIVLKNGMVIFLQEDHELPLIDATMRIRGGNRDVPAAKTGMLDVYGDVWRDRKSVV